MLIADTAGVPREAAGGTHIGLVRQENQDRHDSFSTPFGEVHIVADGMGGHRGGATAAAMVIDGFREALTSLPESMDYRDALRQAAARTNRAIAEMGASGNAECCGMGSTAVLALIRGRELIIAHVGDSRAYLWRNIGIRRLTKDHTAIQQLVDCGALCEAAARSHPHSSLLLRALGQGQEMEPEISRPIPLRDGDMVVLCSDGLSGRVEDARIEETVRAAGGDCRKTVKALIDLALASGGSDNVTVRCVRIGPTSKRRHWVRRLLDGG